MGGRTRDSGRLSLRGRPVEDLFLKVYCLGIKFKFLSVACKTPKPGPSHIFSLISLYSQQYTPDSGTLHTVLPPNHGPPAGVASSQFPNHLVPPLHHCPPVIFLLVFQSLIRSHSLLNRLLCSP